jgi:hypothetical protein
MNEKELHEDFEEILREAKLFEEVLGNRAAPFAALATDTFLWWVLFYWLFTLLQINKIYVMM